MHRATGYGAGSQRETSHLALVIHDVGLFYTALARVEPMPSEVCESSVLNLLHFRLEGSAALQYDRLTSIGFSCPHPPGDAFAASHPVLSIYRYPEVLASGGHTR